MSNLAVSNSGTLDIEKFDMKNFFYTDSFLFRHLTLGEKAITIFEAGFAIFLLVLFSPIMLALQLLLNLVWEEKFCTLRLEWVKMDRILRSISFAQ